MKNKKENKRLVLITLFVALFWVLTVHTALVTAISSNMTGIEPNNILHWYRFENDLTDSGTITAPLTSFGATAYDSPSFANEGTYSFNSANTGLYSTTGTGEGINTSNKFTLGGYINSTGYVNNGGYSLFGVASAGCGVYYTFVFTSATTMYFQANINDVAYTSANLPVTLNEKALWIANYNSTHIIITKDGIEMEVMSATGLLTNGCSAYNYNFYVGSEPTWNSYVIGQYEDWFFYNDSITQSQVEQWAEINSCTPDYYCSHFLTCASNNNLECDTVGDLNECGTPYNGSAGDFNQSCSYTAPSTPLFTETQVGGAIAHGLFNFFLGLSAVIGFVAIGFAFALSIKLKGRK